MINLAFVCFLRSTAVLSIQNCVEITKRLYTLSSQGRVHSMVDKSGVVDVTSDARQVNVVLDLGPELLGSV